MNLGCGPQYLESWINIDINLGNPKPDVLLDLTKDIPLPDAVVDYIFCEDLMSVLTYEQGRYLLSESFRVLKDKGVMRLLTANLRTFALAYTDRSESTLAWHKDRFGCSTSGEMFNAGFHGWGQRFIWDEETMAMRLTELGFDVRERSFNYSGEPILQGIDLRNTADGTHSMYFDCYKHSSPP